MHLALEPSAAPLTTVDVGGGARVRLRVPDDDAVMEALMAKAHAEALAAGADEYDRIMEARCSEMMSDRPAYWAQIWPSSVAAGRRVIEQPALVAGKSVLEVGAGLGLGSVCAAMAGASAVVATDREADAVAFARANAALNDVAVHGVQLDWSQPSPPPEQHGDDAVAALQQPFDLVIAADVVYDESAVPLLARLLHARVASGGGTVLLTDNADRPYGDGRRDGLMKLLCDEGDFVRQGESRCSSVELQTRQGGSFRIAECVLRRV